MLHRGLAAAAGTLLVVAIAPASRAPTPASARRRARTAPAAAGRGFGPAPDGGPSGPRALAAPAPAGEAGIGDPYFPLEGNGGFDVRHYDLTFSYDPATDRLDAVNEIRAVATQTLSRFDLDLQQLDVSAVTVNDKPATFTRDGQELQITPKKKLPAKQRFDVRVTYGGVPQTIVGSPIVFGSPYDVRQRRLPPWRHDAPGPAREDRRRAVLPHPAQLDGRARSRHATTEQFIDLAERISGQDLTAFFQTWLYTTTKPTTW